MEEVAKASLIRSTSSLDNMEKETGPVMSHYNFLLRIWDVYSYFSGGSGNIFTQLALRRKRVHCLI